MKERISYAFLAHSAVSKEYKTLLLPSLWGGIQQPCVQIADLQVSNKGTSDEPHFQATAYISQLSLGQGYE